MSNNNTEEITRVKNYDSKVAELQNTKKTQTMNQNLTRKHMTKPT